MTQTFEHDALIYGTDEALVDTLVPWLREGLEHEDGAVVATTPPRIDQLRDALGSDETFVSFVSSDDLYVHPPQTIASWQRMLSDAADSGVAYTRIVGEVRFGRRPICTRRGRGTSRHSTRSSNTPPHGSCVPTTCGSFPTT